MAIGSDANNSDLTINLDQNFINYGLLYANQNINLNVDGKITNDAANDNAGEIFALSGDVNINGKIYNTSFGNISKYDFFYLGFDKSAQISTDFGNDYIDSNDTIKNKAEQIFNQMITAGYLNAKGDFTQKLIDDVMNYSGSDTQKANQLQLGSFQDYASVVYQKLKAKNGVTSIKNYTTKLENLNGGKITSSLGDINIKAQTFNNIAQDNKDVVSNSENGVSRTQYRGIDSAWKNTVLWGYDSVTSILDSDQSYLQAGKNIDIEADGILNNSSIITAGNNIDIRTNSFSNSRTEFSVSIPYIYETHWKKCSWSGCKEGRYQNWYSSNILLRSNTPSVMSSGSSLNIFAIGDVTIDNPTINTALINSHPLQANSNSSTPISETWQIEIPTTNNGLFKKATPDKSYLIESAYNANDANTLTGSAYYQQRFGFNPNQNQIKWLGDPFYEWNAINQQIIITTNKQQQWNELNWQDNFNKLIDNAYDQQSDLSLVPGVKLTAKQIAALKSDITWYETKTLKLADGSTQLVAVPHVYLAKNSISKIDLNSNNPKESLLLSGNININADGNVTNYGRIIAISDPEQPERTSGNLVINSSGDITNKSTIKTDNSAIFNASGNINNNSNVNLITIAHKGGTDIFSNFAKTAVIESGNISINAGKNFENLAAQIKVNKNDLGNNITSGANFSATAGEDIIISTLELRNRTENTWGNSKKGGHLIDDKITNLGSSFDIAGDLNFITTGSGTVFDESSNINIKGSDISVAGNISVNAKDEFNIIASQNNSYSDISKWKQGLIVSKTSNSGNSSITNILSNLNSNAGNILIKSGSDTNIIGAQLSSNNLTIDSNGDLNIYSVADYYSSWTTNSKSTNLSGITKYVAPNITNIPFIGMAQNILTGNINSKAYVFEQQKITNQASVIAATSDVNLNSNTDLTILGSKLSGNSASLSSTIGNVTIANVMDRETKKSQTNKSKITFSSIASGIIQSLVSATSSYIVNNPTVDQKINTLGANKELPKKQELNEKQSQDETAIASMLNFNSLMINSGKDTNITSSNLITNNGALTINSGNKNIGSTNITTAVENDYSYSFDQKKTPNIASAISNAVAKIFSDITPSFSHDTKSNDDIGELVYNTNSHRIKTRTGNNVAGNIISATDLSINSQDNNLISGSSLIAGTSGAGSINLVSNNGTTIITSAQDTSNTSTETTSQDYNNFRFAYDRGRVSANSSSSIFEETSTTTATTQKSSNLNAATNINITSNTDLDLLSSNLATTNGNVSLISNIGNINILSLANTNNIITKTKTGTQTLSAGIGNAHVDTAYAEYDLILAAKDVADAKRKLNHMETLKANGKSDSDAVEDAKINLAMATANLALAEIKLAATAAKSAASAESLWTGFYGDLRLSITGTKTNSNTISSTSVDSNILSNGNLIISSGMSGLTASDSGNTTITGSSLKSQTGDIQITSRNDTTINASKNTYNQGTTSKAWNESITLASTNAGGVGATIDNVVNAANIALGVGMSRSKSDTSSTTYNNSSLAADSGTIKINTINDATFKGANLLAQDVILNTGGDLTVASLQDSFWNKESSFGLNLGSGAGISKGGSANFGINYDSSKTDRIWTNNQTSILGTNSVTINTGNNTDIIGAIIANSTNGKIGTDAIDGGNLTLNTNSLTNSNLYDHDYSRSSGFGINTSIGIGSGSSANNTTGQGNAPATNQNRQNNFYPNGSTTIFAHNSGYKKEQTTFATIGNGNITTKSTQTFDTNGNLVTSNNGSTNDQTELVGLNRNINKTQDITKDVVSGGIDINATIDLRLLDPSGNGQKEIAKEIQDLIPNLGKSSVAIASDIADIAVKAQEIYQEILPNITPRQQKEITNAIVRSFINNDPKEIEQLMQKYNLSESEKNKVRDYVLGDANSKELIANLDSETRGKLIKVVGVFFDGTGNNKYVDEKSGRETNVAKLYGLYIQEEGTYITGIGTSGGLDYFCQGIGCGLEEKQNEATDFLSRVYRENKDKLLILDLIGFSRGASTSRNYANQVNFNGGIGSIPANTINIRGEYLFDSVASFFYPNNYNLTIPKDVIAIQATATNEIRITFDLQSLKFSDGTLNSNWIEKEFLGNHSGVGGYYAQGDQGKQNDIAKDSLNWMVTQANSLAGTADNPVFKIPDQSQQPSVSFKNDYNNYQSYLSNYNNNPTPQNKIALDNAYQQFKDNYVHSEVTLLKPWNWSISSDREIFYPNDQLKLDGYLYQSKL